MIQICIVQGLTVVYFCYYVVSHCIDIPQFIYLLYDPAILLLGIYPREIKAYVQIKICIQMFIRPLFVLVKNWKKSRCPSTVDFSIRNHRMNWEIVPFRFSGRDCVELVLFPLYIFGRIHIEAIWAWNFLCRKVFMKIKFLRYRTIEVIYCFMSKLW